MTITEAVETMKWNATLCLYQTKADADRYHAEYERQNRRPFSVFWHDGCHRWAFWVPFF